MKLAQHVQVEHVVCNETVIDSKFVAFCYNRKAHHKAHALARLSVHRPLHPRVSFLACSENDRITRTGEIRKSFNSLVRSKHVRGLFNNYWTSIFPA